MASSLCCCSRLFPVKPFKSRIVARWGSIKSPMSTRHWILLPVKESNWCPLVLKVCEECIYCHIKFLTVFGNLKNFYNFWKNLKSFLSNFGIFWCFIKSPLDCITSKSVKLGFICAVCVPGIQLLSYKKFPCHLDIWQLTYVNNKHIVSRTVMHKH